MSSVRMSRIAIPGNCRTGAEFVLTLAVFFLGLGSVLPSVVPSVVAQSAPVAKEDDVYRGTVGLPISIQQKVIPGPALVVKPSQDRHNPLVVRIVNTYPHGTDHRYDFEVYALESGRFDLSEYLTLTDLTSAEKTVIAPLWIEVASTIEDGIVQPHEVEPKRIPAVGGYRLWSIIGGIAWFTGLIAWVFAARKRAIVKEEVSLPPLSVADRLRPLVRAARDQSLTSEGKAELERTIIAFWCKKLGLEKVSPSDVIMELKTNGEAAPLILAMENWLHAPAPDAEINLDALLSPYEDISDRESGVPS